MYILAIAFFVMQCWQASKIERKDVRFWVVVNTLAVAYYVWAAG